MRCRMDVQDWLHNYNENVFITEVAKINKTENARTKQLEKELFIFKLALNNLPSKYADIITERYINNQSYNRIAINFSCSRSTVYNKLKVAEKSLAETIDYICNNL